MIYGLKKAILESLNSYSILANAFKEWSPPYEWAIIPTFFPVLKLRSLIEVFIAMSVFTFFRAKRESNGIT